MNDATPVDPVRGALEQELGLVQSAILMVASGGAAGVSLGGLRFGEELVAPAREMARRAGVRVVPLYTADDAGADLRFERLHDG